MRIIAGRFKGRQLRCPDSDGVRPTGSLVRGAIFNIIRDVVPGAEVLDIYAGSGALGLEALSQGAGHVVLVESNRQAAEVLLRNIDMLKAGAEVDLVPMDALGYLERCRTKFGLILADPPYDEEVTPLLLERISNKVILEEWGVAVIQEPAKRQPCPGHKELQLWKTRKHGKTMVTFYRYQTNLFSNIYE